MTVKANSTFQKSQYNSSYLVGGGTKTNVLQVSNPAIAELGPTTSPVFKGYPTPFSEQKDYIPPVEGRNNFSVMLNQSQITNPTQQLLEKTPLNTNKVQLAPVHQPSNVTPKKFPQEIPTIVSP